MANVTGYFRGSSYVSQQISSTIPGQATSVSVTDSWNFSFNTSGTGDDKNNLYAATTLSMVAGVPQTVNFQALTDPYGVTAAFTNIHWIAIKNQSTTDRQTLTIGYPVSGGAQANAWSGFVSNPGQIIVYPSTSNNDGVLVVTAPTDRGLPVGGDDGYLLQFDSGIYSFNVDLQIAGYYAVPPQFVHVLTFGNQSAIFNRRRVICGPRYGVGSCNNILND